MRHAIFLLAAVVAPAAVALPVPQGATLQPGDLLENGGDQRMKVLRCRAVSYGRECETVLWEDGKAASNPAWWAEDMLVKGDARVRAALGKPPRVGMASVPSRRAPTATSAAPRPAPLVAGGRIHDGAYRCQMWMGGSYVSLGRVRSVNGTLNPNPLAKVGATITGVSPSDNGITVHYTTARGYRETLDCTRE